METIKTVISLADYRIKSLLLHNLKNLQLHSIFDLSPISNIYL